METDRFEYLGAAIALNGGDSHLCHGLDDTFDGGFDEILDRFFMIKVRQHTLQNHIVQRFKCQIRVDGIDAITEQHGKVMHLTRFTGFKYQRNECTCTAGNQVVMQAGHRKQGRNCGIVPVDATVGKHQDVTAGFDRHISCGKKCFKSLFHGTGTT